MFNIPIFNKASLYPINSPFMLYTLGISLHFFNLTSSLLILKNYFTAVLSANVSTN